MGTRFTITVEVEREGLRAGFDARAALAGLLEGGPGELPESGLPPTETPDVTPKAPATPPKVVRPGDLVAQRLAMLDGGTDAEVEQARQAVKDAMEAADE